MTDEIKQLISQLDIEQSRKQALLDKLDKSGVTAELAEEVKAILRENETAIRAEAPELMTELEQVHKQAQDQVDQAHQEFNSEMDKIDQEAGALHKQASKDLDDAQLEDSRAALS